MYLYIISAFSLESNMWEWIKSGNMLLPCIHPVNTFTPTCFSVCLCFTSLYILNSFNQGSSRLEDVLEMIHVLMQKTSYIDEGLLCWVYLGHSETLRVHYTHSDSCCLMLTYALQAVLFVKESFLKCCKWYQHHKNVFYNDLSLILTN